MTSPPPPPPYLDGKWCTVHAAVLCRAAHSGVVPSGTFRALDWHASLCVPVRAAGRTRLPRPAARLSSCSGVGGTPCSTSLLVGANTRVAQCCAWAWSPTTLTPSLSRGSYLYPTLYKASCAAVALTAPFPGRVAQTPKDSRPDLAGLPLRTPALNHRSAGHAQIKQKKAAAKTDRREFRSISPLVEEAANPPAAS